MEQKVKWAISSKIFEKPGYPRIEEALKRAGIEYFQSEYNKNTFEYEEIPYTTEQCVVMYGPIQFIRKNNKGYLPGAFGFKSDSNVSFYTSQMPSDWFFNSDGIFIPFGSIINKACQLDKLFGDKIFIRPDSGFKSFTGFSTKIENLKDEIYSLKQIYNIGNDELCFIAKSKKIHSEYRIVIVENQVVTGSQYRWNGKLDVRIDVDHSAWKFAEKVAKHPYQLDTAYVVDIFIGDDDPKIGEFNSFASSGLYNCDIDKVVKSISSAALNEWLL